MKNELRNNKILLIEDEFYISDLYKMILESAGFEVILAVNGDIPVLLFTNLGQESIIKMAFGEGATGYFLKARLKPEDLTQTVNYFLEHLDSKMDVNNLTFD